MREKKWVPNWWLLLTLALLLAATVNITKSWSMLDYRNLLARPRAAPSLTLHYGRHSSQFAELWLPQNAGPRPVIIMIHGGCWQQALPGVELMAYLAEDLRRSGFAIWNLEYRRLGEDGGGYPGTFDDVAAGADYLRSIASQHRLDLSHVSVIGHSAGGQLALWLAARRRIGTDSALYRANPLPVQNAITLAGINDLAAYRKTGPDACGGPITIDRLAGAEQRRNRDIYIDTSPAAMLPLGASQLIVSGDSDPIVPARFGHDYAASARRAGDAAEDMTIPGAGHFELIDPESMAWTRVKAWLLAR